jgi:hypothetical protein
VEGFRAALNMRLLLDLPEDGGSFRTLADQATMAQALWTGKSQGEGTHGSAEDREERTIGSSGDDERSH